MAKVAHTAKFVEAPVMTRRALLAVPALAALAGALGGCSQDSSADAGSSAGSSQTSDEGRTLVVAMELAYPPFETKDGAGEPSGISVDFMRDFGEAYG